MAKKILTQRERQKRLLDRLQAEWDALTELDGVINEVDVSEKTKVILYGMLVDKAAAVGHCAERLAELGSRHDCRWKTVFRSYAQSKKVEVSSEYTEDTDSEGWYWWRVRSSKRSSIEFGGIPVWTPYTVNGFAGSQTEGKCRKRVDARKKALTKAEEMWKKAESIKPAKRSKKANDHEAR